MSKNVIEFDVLDCKDKIVIYDVSCPDTESPEAAYYRIKQYEKNIKAIETLYKPKLIIRIKRADSIKVIDDVETAIKMIDEQINELIKVKTQLLNGNGDINNDKENS